MKLEQLIPSGIKDAMMEVTSKPKRRRMKPQIVASTEDHRRQILGEIKSLDKTDKERNHVETLIPVLFLWGMPQKRLNKTEAQTYKSMGSRIEYIKESELNTLNI
jgi:hypothetical protein